MRLGIFLGFSDGAPLSFAFEHTGTHAFQAKPLLSFGFENNRKRLKTFNNESEDAALRVASNTSENL